MGSTLHNNLLFITVVFFEVSLVNFLKVVKIIRAFRVDALMEDKVFAAFLRDKGIAAMRAARLNGRKAALGRGEPGGTDLAEELALGTIVFVEERLRGITARAGAIIRNVTLTAAADRTDLLAIELFVVRDKIFVSPVLPKVGDQREFINCELLVLWGMGVIKSPLFERDISADKVNQPAVLVIKDLNCLE